MTSNTTINLVQDGTTSVALDTDLLTEAAGLTLTSVDNTVDPISEEFAVGFDISETSDFIFSDKNGFTPIAGEIEHTGTVTFASAAGDIIVGDFAIGFNASRITEDASGFFVENTVAGVLPDGAILFDISNPESLEITESELKIGDADLLVAPEFASTLLETTLAADNLTGADVGDAAINAITIDLTDLNLGRVKDGTTSVALDTDLLTEAAGLTLTGANHTVDPISHDYAVGFDITEESDFIFSNQNGFTPIAGEIKHTGTVTFSSEVGHITVGDFDIGYDASRVTEDTSGFYVKNTVDDVLPDGAILFDVSNPESLDISESKLSLGKADLLVAKEFASTLLETGLAANDLTGADVGDAAIDAIFGYDII